MLYIRSASRTTEPLSQSSSHPTLSAQLLAPPWALPLHPAAASDGLSPAHPDSESRRSSGTLCPAVSISVSACGGGLGTELSVTSSFDDGEPGPGQLRLKHPEGPGKMCLQLEFRKLLSRKDPNPKSRSSQSLAAPWGQVQRPQGPGEAPGHQAPRPHPASTCSFRSPPGHRPLSGPRRNPDTIRSFLPFSRTGIMPLRPYTNTMWAPDIVPHAPSSPGHTEARKCHHGGGRGVSCSWAACCPPCPA